MLPRQSMYVTNNVRKASVHYNRLWSITEPIPNRPHLHRIAMHRGNDQYRHPYNLILFSFFLMFVMQKYPPSATTLHFEFYAEPSSEVKVEKKVCLESCFPLFRHSCSTLFFLLLLRKQLISLCLTFVVHSCSLNSRAVIRYTTFILNNLIRWVPLVVFICCPCGAVNGST